MTSQNASPLSAPDDSAPTAGVKDQPVSLRVLLAEDDIVNQRLGCMVLQKLGHQAVCVGNGLKALEQLAANSFDVVILDVEMPELGGPDTAARIRSGASGVLDPDIPILGLSGHGEGPERNRCLDAGMNGYLVKPMSIEHIRRALAEFVPKM